MESGKRTAVRLRPKSRTSTSGTPPRFAVFTSVDGTLLDAHTFDAGPNKAMVRKLVNANVPVIPISVMTLEEIEPIAIGLGLRKAMIIEAGGAIARWKNHTWEVEPCGPPAETLLDVVREIEDRSGARLLIYSALSESDAAELSGRSGTMLYASMHRSFSEPFLLESGDFEMVRRAAAALGFSVRRGRRFLHLARECDEGEAFTRLRDELQCELTVAVGGALVDAEFLVRADLPIVVPGPNGELDSELLHKVPHARVAPTSAPDGWAAAVEEAWRSLDVLQWRAGRA